MNLEDYLKINYKNNVIDHSIRVSHIDENGHPNIYIHPMLVGGETLDFQVIENELLKTNWGIKPEN